ncbi:MAG: J domain-containing protein [Archangiaceae bacterium]|nr:J domain-containing protein [Archangiaceae bacterium]
MRLSTATRTLEDVEVECTHCKVAMTCHVGSSAQVRYFHCASCHRWVSSMYSEVFRGDAKVQARRRGEAGAGAFDAVKERLERWLSALDEQDPYRLLGVSKNDSAERIRERYRELAVLNHPDRGGSPENMQRINEAYERIALHREHRESGVSALTRLPAPSAQ